MDSGAFWRQRLLRCGVFSFFLILSLVSPVFGQDLPQTPFKQSSWGGTGTGLDLTPSNPLGLPGTTGGLPRGSDSVSLNSGMFPGLLPNIPNLEVGYMFNFGPNVGQGRGIIDYVFPVGLGDGVVFGEAHGEFQNFWKTQRSKVIVPSRPGAKGESAGGVGLNRIDISIGGGYRKLLGAGQGFAGVNAFFDTTRLNERWYSSGGFGLEMASRLPGEGLMDLNFNYYGNLFTKTAFLNAFRYGTGNFDVEAGYSQPLFDGDLDLRLKAVGYQFDIGTKVYGYRVGAALTTRNGMFTVKYDYTRDRINGPYHSVGGHINVAFQLENLFKGVSPVSKPEPVFRSPRNLRRLLKAKVRRNWHQPAQVIVARSLPASGTKYAFTQVVYARVPPEGTGESGNPAFDNVVSSMGVSGGPTSINQVVLTLFMNHTYVGDLTIRLQSPNGTTLTALVTYQGGGQPIETFLTFDDAAGETISGSSPYPVDGTYAPNAPGMALFNGQNANGEWVLTVEDNWAIDIGWLNSWRLDIIGTP